jgi:TolB-like protein
MMIRSKGKREMSRSMPSALAIPLLAGMICLAAAPLGAQAEPKLSISVLYFDNTTGNEDLDWLSEGLADMTATDLAASPRAVLVERERLEKVLREQELAYSGMADPSTAPELGRILNAGILVYGSFIASGSALRLDAKAVSSETGAILAAAQATAEASEVFKAQAELSSRLAAGLGLELRRAPEIVGTEVAKAYYRGLSLYDQGRYAEALELFKGAQDLDPGFSKPGKSIEDAYKYLKDFKRQRFRREMNEIADDIDRLGARLAAPTFYSFADALRDPGRFGYRDAAEVDGAFKAHPRAWAGDTPVQAAWELQDLYSGLADLGMEYFEDERLQAYCFDRILELADAAERGYPDDPFLPEPLYQKLFVYRERGQKQAVKDLCERLMRDWPSYRMMWAVENFYEDALVGLGLASPAEED